MCLCRITQFDARYSNRRNCRLKCERVLRLCTKAGASSKALSSTLDLGWWKEKEEEEVGENVGDEGEKFKKRFQRSCWESTVPSWFWVTTWEILETWSSLVKPLSWGCLPLFFGLLAARLAFFTFLGDSTFFLGTAAAFFGEAAGFLATAAFLVPTFFVLDADRLDLVFLGLAAVEEVPVDAVELTAVVAEAVDFFFEEAFFFPDLFFLVVSPGPSLYEALTFLNDEPAPRCSEILTCFLAASGSTLKF